MKFNYIIDDKVYTEGTRDIIKVTDEAGKVQPFYRSTGHNSKKPGQWLPFDGLLVLGGEVVWFIKDNYSQKEKNGDNGPLHRYGTEELKYVSQILGDFDLGKGVEEDPNIINQWLGVNNGNTRKR